MAIEATRKSIFIAGSCVVSLSLIFLAYTTSGPTPFSVKKVDAESTHDLLVQYADKDSDSDGLPDWEESLYGTDPNNPHSVSPTLTDAEAVAQGLVKPRFESATTTPINTNILPGVDAASQTVTGQFGRELLGQYLLQRGGSAPSANDIATFVQQHLDQLKQSRATSDAFNQGQVHVSGSGRDALLSYEASVETIVTDIDNGMDEDEVTSLAAAVNKGDTKALVTVRAYAARYATAARALMKLSVPQEVAESHLAFANGLMHVSESVSDMGAFDTDPLRTMLGIATYQSNVALTIKALAQMNTVFVGAQAVPGTGTLGSDFYQMTVQAASQK